MASSLQTSIPPNLHTSIHLYVFDLDGVIYRMDDPIPEAIEAISRLHARGDRVYYLTNNSSKSRLDYVHKLADMGIEATEDDIMTSAFALGQWFVERGEAGKTVYVI